MRVLKGVVGGVPAQSVKHPTAAQVMISWFVRLSPALGSTLIVQSLLGILSIPVSLPLPLLARSVCRPSQWPTQRQSAVAESTGGAGQLWILDFSTEQLCPTSPSVKWG